MSGLDLSRLPLVRGVHTVADFRSQAAIVSSLFPVLRSVVDD
jgi:hypothetical protein